MSTKTKQDIHGSLLVWKIISLTVLQILNELLRISDAEFEKLKLEVTGTTPEMPPITEPIDWLMHPRFCTTVESSTARQLIRDHFRQVRN